jgi:hypothetical protein
VVSGKRSEPCSQSRIPSPGLGPGCERRGQNDGKGAGLSQRKWSADKKAQLSEAMNGIKLTALQSENTRCHFNSCSVAKSLNDSAALSTPILRQMSF